MKFFVIFVVIMPLLAIFPAHAIEVYQWVDANGVVHFSQNAPPGNVQGVEVRTLENNPPADYDPEEDRYGVQAQAESMAQLRAEMEEKRERDRQQNTSQQPVQQVQQPVQSAYPLYGRPPYYPGMRPPLKPQPPVRPEPYPVETLRPPGRSPD